MPASSHFDAAAATVPDASLPDCGRKGWGEEMGTQQAYFHPSRDTPTLRRRNSLRSAFYGEGWKPN